MERRKLPTLVLALLALVVIVAVPFTSCQSMVPPVDAIAMCTSTDPETFAPITKVTTFAPDTPIMYCSVHVKDLPANAKLKTEWYYLERSGKSQMHVKFNEQSLTPPTSSITGYIRFHADAPKDGWLKGYYEIRITVNDQQKGSISFKVQ